MSGEMVMREKGRFEVLGENEKGINALSQEFQRVVEAQNKTGKQWAIVIGPNRHIVCEAWQYLGQRAGVVAETESCDAITENGAYIGHKAKSVVRRIDNGQIISGAIAECHSSETSLKKDGKIFYRWQDSQGNPVRHAISGMAQTRANSRALASALRFLAVMAGFSGTPAEEMPQGQAWENGDGEKTASAGECCPEHGQAKRRAGKDGSPYCSARVGDGYCRWKPGRVKNAKGAWAEGKKPDEAKPPANDGSDRWTAIYGLIAEKLGFTGDAAKEWLLNMTACKKISEIPPERVDAVIAGLKSGEITQ